MVKILFIKDSENRIKSVELIGHAEFAVNGEPDILCSAISATSELIAFGILRQLELNAIVFEGEEEGYFKIEVPWNGREKAQDLLGALLGYYKELEIKFSKNMEVLIK